MILLEKNQKHQFNDLLNATVETEDKWLDKKLNSNLCYGGLFGGGGGGGGGQQDVAPTLRPYVTDILSRAQGVYGPQVPYQAYPGERIVGFSPLEQLAQQGIVSQATLGGMAGADPRLSMAGSYYGPAYGALQSGLGAQYGAGQFLGGIAPSLGMAETAYGQAGDIYGMQMPTLGQASRLYGTQEQILGEAAAPIGQIQTELGLAGQLGTEAAGVQRGAARGIGREEAMGYGLTGQDIAQYMSPYQQAVTDIAKQEAVKDTQKMLEQVGAQAAGMGGFGGSRQAILESQLASDLGKRLSDIQTRGSQEAYQQALQTAAQQQQFGYGLAGEQRQRESQLGAALAGLAGQRQGLGTAGYGSLAEQIRGQAGAYGGIGGQYGQLAGQIGGVGQTYAGLGGAYGGLSGLYGQGAGAYGQQAAGLAGFAPAFTNLGQSALGQSYRELGYMSGVGEAQRGLEQQRADLAYQEFLKQREYPTEQLQKYSSLIQGFPFQFATPTAQPSQLQQMAGTALTAYGLSGMFRKAGGSMQPTEKDYPNAGLAALAKKNPEVVSRMGYNKGGQIKGKTNYLQGGGLSGILSPLNYIMPASNQALSKTLSSRKQELIQQLSQARDITEAERIKRLIQDVDQRLATSVEGAKQDELQAQQEAAQQVADISAVQRSLGLPVTGLSNQIPAGFSGETPRPIYPEYLQERDIADAKKAEEEKPKAAKEDKGNKVQQSAATKEEEGLEKLLEEAYKFDREAKEKAIKAQQGFDIAALGLQLMSKPLSEISPQMISQLGVSQKELAGLSEEEAKNKLQKELTRVAIKKSKADTEETLAKAAEARATAGYYSGLGGLKEQVPPYEMPDITKLTSPTELLNADLQKIALQYANELTELYNGPAGIGLSKEQKQGIINKEVAKILSGEITLGEEPQIPPVGRTAGRILG